MNIHDVLQQLIAQGGSDLHLLVGLAPVLRVKGVLSALVGAPQLNTEQIESLILPLMTQEQQEFVKVNKELDFAYQYQDVARFRVNVYHAQGQLAAALRLIPNVIRSIDELMLPPILHEFTKYKQGLVLVTGPTGEGKSTTLAAIIEEINTQRSEHILTIEDPIEFIYHPKKSIISQRELNHDTQSWEMALRSALREDPNVVLVGEMRDYETIAAAITVAETGHLVFATLHTASAAQTVDRIIDVFPAHQQGQVRQQLSGSLNAVISQRLLPSIGGDRIAAMEVMLANSAVRNLIREAKTHQLDNVIQTSSGSGMILMEYSLQSLIAKGMITTDTARRYAFRSEELERLLGKSGEK